MARTSDLDESSAEKLLAGQIAAVAEADAAAIRGFVDESEEGDGQSPRAADGPVEVEFSGPDAKIEDPGRHAVSALENHERFSRGLELDVADGLGDQAADGGDLGARGVGPGSAKEEEEAEEEPSVADLVATWENRLSREPAPAVVAAPARAAPPPSLPEEEEEPRGRSADRPRREAGVRVDVTARPRGGGSPAWSSNASSASACGVDDRSSDVAAEGRGEQPGEETARQGEAEQEDGEEEEAEDEALEDEDLIRELEETLRQQELILLQTRSDYQTRLQRSAELTEQLRGVEAELARQRRRPVCIAPAPAPAAGAGLPVQSAQELSECREAMRREDALAAGRRTLEAQDGKLALLRQRAETLQRGIQQLSESRDPVIVPTLDVVNDVLQEKQQRIAALQREAEAKAEAVELLGRDTRMVLDFMMRVHIEAGGGPRPGLTSEDFLPAAVRESLDLSAHGQLHIGALFQKYAAHISLLGGHAGDGLEEWPPGHGPSESLDAEVRLLRGSLADEMRQVAEVLAQEDDATTPAMLRQEKELLRAAAWGDGQTVEELVHPVGTLALRRSGSGHSTLLGWTAWHAAAAHNQAGVLQLLNDQLPGSGLTQCTASGWLPMAVGCLQGFVAVVQLLLRSRASPNSADRRGNSALFWAMTQSDEEPLSRRTLVQALVDAHADPSRCNRSGHRLDLSHFNLVAPAPLGRAAGAAGQELTLFAGGPAGSGHRLQVVSREEEEEQEVSQDFLCVRVSSCGSEEGKGFLAAAISRLRTPARDAVGFMRNSQARASARLEQVEADTGVWSDWALNHTYGNSLASVLQANEPSEHLERSRQAVVITCQRLLFLDAVTFQVAKAVRLREIAEVVVPPQSRHVLLLRAQGWPDTLLESPARDRLLDELQLAASRERRGRPFGIQGNHGDGGGGIRVSSAREVLTRVYDKSHFTAGLLAFTEPEVFMLLPYAPRSVLLTGMPALQVGFLELQRRTQPRAPGAGVCWKWQSFFFALKAGGRWEGPEQQLVWCTHPNATQCAGIIPLGSIKQVRPLDAAYGDSCLVIEHSSTGAAGSSIGASQARSVTVRAPSAEVREAWVQAILGASGRD